jgi:hypothetical protein
MRSLYQRRLASTEAMLPVEPWEREVFLRRQALSPAARPYSGLHAAHNALAEVGIDLRIGEEASGRHPSGERLPSS